MSSDLSYGLHRGDLLLASGLARADVEADQLLPRLYVCGSTQQLYPCSLHSEELEGVRGRREGRQPQGRRRIEGRG